MTALHLVVSTAQPPTDALGPCERNAYRENAARYQHPPRFLQHRLVVRDMLQDLGADNDIERVIGKRQAEPVGNKDVQVFVRVFLWKIAAPTARGHNIPLTHIYGDNLAGGSEPIGSQGVAAFATAQIKNSVARL